MRWAEVEVAVPDESREAVGQALMDCGCKGVAETVGARAMIGWLPVTDDLEASLALLRLRIEQLPSAGLPEAGPTVLRYAEDTGWADEWRKYFRPLEIGRRLVIKPSWEPYETDPDRCVVELDPGMAFGTGGHPTTRLCLEVLEDIVRDGHDVADIGCGSGILSIAAAVLGARRVVASEIDQLPRQIAVDNVAKNGLSDRVAVLDPDRFSELGGAYDIVVANIIAPVIVELTPMIARILRPGALFVSSGIVDEQLQSVLDAISSESLSVNEVRADDYWRTVVASKPCSTSS